MRRVVCLLEASGHWIQRKAIVSEGLYFHHFHYLDGKRTKLRKVVIVSNPEVQALF
jgi:hypothetical protein